jgi:outer membrane murein-binding lipoprotein Lpp
MTSEELWRQQFKEVSDNLLATIIKLNEANTTIRELNERILDLERDLDNARAEFDEYRSEDRRS